MPPRDRLTPHQPPSLPTVIATSVTRSAARLTSRGTAQTFAPLVPEPGKIICLGLNFHDHAKEGGRDKPDYPWFFYRGKSSLIAHGQPGVVPREMIVGKAWAVYFPAPVVAPPIPFVPDFGRLRFIR